MVMHKVTTKPQHKANVTTKQKEEFKLIKNIHEIAVKGNKVE